jgi:hypothetical protein
MRQHGVRHRDAVPRIFKDAAFFDKLPMWLTS